MRIFGFEIKSHFWEQKMLSYPTYLLEVEWKDFCEQKATTTTTTTTCRFKNFAKLCVQKFCQFCFVLQFNLFAV